MRWRVQLPRGRRNLRGRGSGYACVKTFMFANYCVKRAYAWRWSVAVAVRWPASDCADVVEAVTAAHDAVALFGEVLKDLDDGVDDGAEDDGDVSINRFTINISKIPKNPTKQSYSAMRLNNISALRRWRMHSHSASHLTIRRRSIINRRACRGTHFSPSLRRLSSLQPRRPPLATGHPAALAIAATLPRPPATPKKTTPPSCNRVSNAPGDRDDIAQSAAISDPACHMQM